MQSMQQRFLLSRQFIWKMLLQAVIGISISGCINLESSFSLSPDSRFPKWLEVPKDLSRNELSLTMEQYSIFSGMKYVFKFKKKGNLLNIEKIVVYDHQRKILESDSRPLGFYKGYPAYEAITVKGVVDIVEYRAMEPVFYMTDDPEIWKELGANRPAPVPATPGNGS